MRKNIILAFAALIAVNAANAQLLVNDGKAVVLGDIACRYGHVDKHRVHSASGKLGEAFQETVAGDDISERRREIRKVFG